jgi:hypothetical protein
LGRSAPDPIFVVGLPRSGSTLIEQILSSHSQVEGTMELPEIIAMTRELRRSRRSEGGRSYHDVLWRRWIRRRVPRLGPRHYIARTRVQRKTGAPFFIDKMPNNFQHVGLIHLILPNAKDHRCAPAPARLLLLRVQAAFRAWPELQLRPRRSRPLLPRLRRTDGALRRGTARPRASRDLRAHGRRHGTRSAALLDYCGLPFEDGCLRFFENERPVRTASSEQVRRPINRDGVDQWRHYEPWLDPLKAALGDGARTYPDRRSNSRRRGRSRNARNVSMPFPLVFSHIRFVPLRFTHTLDQGDGRESCDTRPTRRTAAARPLSRAPLR